VEGGIFIFILFAIVSDIVGLHWFLYGKCMLAYSLNHSVWTCVSVPQMVILICLLMRKAVSAFYNAGIFFVVYLPALKDFLYGLH
jgi:hypothetical protein